MILIGLSKSFENALENCHYFITVDLHPHAVIGEIIVRLELFTNLEGVLCLNNGRKLFIAEIASLASFFPYFFLAFSFFPRILFLSLPLFTRDFFVKSLLSYPIHIYDNVII